VCHFLRNPTWISLSSVELQIGDRDNVLAAVHFDLGGHGDVDQDSRGEGQLDGQCYEFLSISAGKNGEKFDSKYKTQCYDKS
jgi:hypothetical protein